MNSIKYRYSLDENNELIDIETVDKDTKKNQHYHCLECGEEMIPAIGTKNKRHFRHKAGLICNGESYLHKLAKRMIRDKFLSSNDFRLTYTRRETCLEHKTCRWENNIRCHDKHTTFNDNLRQYYNQCEEEITIDTFRADLLLTNKDKPDRKPILIEIYKTHKSTDQKLNSNHRIIETLPIETEDNIIDIIEHGFVEGRNCTVHNFRQSNLSKEPFCHLYEDKGKKMFYEHPKKIYIQPTLKIREHKCINCKHYNLIKLGFCRSNRYYCNIKGLSTIFPERQECNKREVMAEVPELKERLKFSTITNSGMQIN